jgi:hypothetical protein
MAACASALALPSSALAQDPAAEVPDVSVSRPQTITSDAAFSAAKRSSAPELWATVNICDTPDNPDRMGVRASMAGNGIDGRMRMRFAAEYWSRARQAWTAIPGSGVSPWVRVGSSRLSRRQAGWTFSFAPPPSGVTFTMRATVEFQWRARPDRKSRRRRGWRVLRSDARPTETGMRGVLGGDPAGTSKAMCLIY